MRRPNLATGAVIAMLGLTLVVSPASAITNGTRDDGDHPNVGIMYMDNLPALVYGFCSGSLLAADEFLVAGHCTAAASAYLGWGLIDPSNVRVSFDESFTVDAEGIIHTETWVGVTGWDTDPALLYDNGILRNDVGVMHLATAQTTITPIDLPEAGFLDTEAAAGRLRGHDFVSVGYGLNSLDRPLSNPTAVWTWDHARMASESAFQALSSNNLLQNGGPCAGDSGGPHFWAPDSNLVVAVTSSGNPICGTKSLDASQRLDIESVLGFLEDYVD